MSTPIEAGTAVTPEIQAAFRASLTADGYTEILTREMAPDAVLPDHEHAWDARLMVTTGEMSLTHRGQTVRYTPGQWCEVPVGERHAEVYGPQGCSLLIGRRYPG